MQGSNLVAGRELLVSQSGGGARLVGQHAHHGVERRVDSIDTSQVRIHDFCGGKLSTRNALSQLGSC